ncbi:MAG: hypothetical protein IJ088_12005 [Clostridia bacterium]|nr:hypothetical protein [Clostridia bacterium]
MEMSHGDRSAGGKVADGYKYRPGYVVPGEERGAGIPAAGLNRADHFFRGDEGSRVHWRADRSGEATDDGTDSG